MSIDLTTFVFEAINFGVLVWLMQRLVYRPLRNGILERREAIDQRERTADERIEDAERQLRAGEQDRAELVELRDKVLREANEEAAEQRARIVAQAQQDAEAERARVRRLLTAEREAALSWVTQIAVERGTEVAGLLLMQLAPDAIDDALFEQLRAELARVDLSGVEIGDHPEVSVGVATMPDQERLNALRDSLEHVLGRTPRLSVREDESLRAGMVVRIGHRVLDATVAGQLDVFRDRVRHELEMEAEVA